MEILFISPQSLPCRKLPLPAFPTLFQRHSNMASQQTQRGKIFQFCVVEFIEGTTLKEVWDQMSGEDQHSVATAVVEALRKLNSVRLSDSAVQPFSAGHLETTVKRLSSRQLLGDPSRDF